MKSHLGKLFLSVEIPSPIVSAVICPRGRKADCKVFKKSFRLMIYYLLWWVENGNGRKCMSMCRNNAQVLDGWSVPSCVAWTRSSWAASVLSTKPHSQGRVKEEL